VLITGYLHTGPDDRCQGFSVWAHWHTCAEKAGGVLYLRVILRPDGSRFLRMGWSDHAWSNTWDGCPPSSAWIELRFPRALVRVFSSDSRLNQPVSFLVHTPGPQNWGLPCSLQTSWARIKVSTPDAPLNLMHGHSCNHSDRLKREARHSPRKMELTFVKA